jgi:hypothetical protein
MRQPTEIIRIDPRDFISTPDEDCPACGAAGQLGLLMVTATAYRKRCRVCMQDQVRELPALAPKRVLYLDQMAISNLLKCTLSEHQHKFADDNPATHHGFWTRLLGQLERLVHLNLLVCPLSSIHELEAAFDPRLSGNLRSFHSQLAGDIDLEHHETVKRFQLELACRAWLEHSEPEPLNVGDVIHGRLDAWLDRFTVNANYPVTQDELDGLRVRREETDERLQGAVSEWRKQSSRSFAEFFSEQLDAYGPGMASTRPFDLMSGLRREIEVHGVPPEDCDAQMDAFLHSASPATITFAQVAAGLLATISWRASRNQLARPTRGLLNDIQSISTYLPLVDGMFVDNECARFLQEPELNGRLPYSAQVFSLESRDDLLNWLTEIENSAPAGHEQLVERVYGSGWLKPRASPNPSSIAR